ncbi:activating signal cointegrator 1 complex subunit 2 [Tachypleus tridentatus]|uniref:activating signal cointegrator 1 complex subunit 2 n=1 Tax=Tachypleus tridentatus TaxID=6853 RepID=UPI003FD54BA5
MASTNERKKVEEFTSKPLDELFLDVVNKQGNSIKVSALHKGFAEPINFILYKPPPTIKSNKKLDGHEMNDWEKADIEEWLDRMVMIEDDLHHLLKMPHHRFWSQVVFDETLKNCLGSYLSYAPRYYDLDDLMVTEEMKQAFQQVHRLVFMVYLRMSTYKETKSAHITPKQFGTIIYDNYLFDIPKLMDLAVLYSQGNEALLHKMVENIFMAQRSYENDLSEAVPTILEVFDTIQKKLGLDHDSQSEETAGPQKLDEVCQPLLLTTIPWPQLQDVILYLVDTLVTLCAFLDVYPPACHVFYQQGTAPRLASFYESTFYPLEEELIVRVKNEEIKNIVKEVRKRISLSKFCLIKIFRNILVHSCIQPIIEASSNNQSGEVPFLEDLLQVLSTCLSEKRFICDYQKMFPFEDDLDMLSQTKFSLDSTRTEYILNSIYASYELLGQSCERKQVSLNVTAAENKGHNSTAVQDNDTTCLENGLQYLEEACGVPNAEGIELELLITQVLDLLPELGPGFVEECLKYYNFEVELVINALLEDSLPEELASLDRSMERRKEQPKKPAVLANRKCIYDNDEFDIYSNDTVDTSRIHKGKRESKHSNLSELMNEKEELQSMRAFYKKYDNIVEEKDLDPNLYDDEYDDTYDLTALGPDTPPLTDELTLRRPFTIPRVLENPEENKEEVKNSEEYQTHLEKKNVEEVQKTDEFVSDPAQQRAEAQQRWQDKHQHRSPQNRSCRGKPKGQGQEEQTVHNRNFKDRHKHRIGNHNRRVQSDRKKGRGMIPI